MLKHGSDHPNSDIRLGLFRLGGGFKLDRASDIFVHDKFMHAKE